MTSAPWSTAHLMPVLMLSTIPAPTVWSPSRIVASTRTAIDAAAGRDALVHLRAPRAADDPGHVRAVADLVLGHARRSP